MWRIAVRFNQKETNVQLFTTVTAYLFEKWVGALEFRRSSDYKQRRLCQQLVHQAAQIIRLGRFISLFIHFCT